MHNLIKERIDTNNVWYSKLSVKTVENTDEEQSVYFLIRVVGKPRNSSTELFGQVSNNSPEQMQPMIKSYLRDRFSRLKVDWNIDDTEVKFYNEGSEPPIYKSNR